MNVTSSFMKRWEGAILSCSPVIPGSEEQVPASRLTVIHSSFSLILTEGMVSWDGLLFEKVENVMVNPAILQ
jgi:hypothetical protein